MEYIECSCKYCVPYQRSHTLEELCPECFQRQEHGSWCWYCKGSNYKPKETP